MRLLHTQTLELREFLGKDKPPYAILSHRWEEEEVTFQDFQLPKRESMKGFQKILGAAKQVGQDGYEWIWIDTCCIDKTSSAELSEAINSMFAWYERSQICYAFLSDVPAWVRNHRESNLPFAHSKWFTRGWTLQELLAPAEVIFFNVEWTPIGKKTDETMQWQLGQITGIRHMSRYKHACVAQKMSWAAKRETTRIEDMAYCLLGLFGVYLPPLYGEEENAFKRLQLAIMKSSADQSIFAWRTNSTSALNNPYTGLLASSPSDFRDSGNVVVGRGVPTSFFMTNMGLQIQLPVHLLTMHEGSSVAVYRARLNCQNYEARVPPYKVSVYLVRLGSRRLLSRVFPDKFADRVPGREDEDEDDYFQMPRFTTRDVPTMQLTEELVTRKLIHVMPTQEDHNIHFNYFKDVSPIDISVRSSELQNGLSKIITHYGSFWFEPRPYLFRFCKLTHEACLSFSMTEPGTQNIVRFIIDVHGTGDPSEKSEREHTVTRLSYVGEQNPSGTSHRETAVKSCTLYQQFDWSSKSWSVVLPGTNRLLKLDRKTESEWHLLLEED